MIKTTFKSLKVRKVVIFRAVEISCSVGLSMNKQSLVFDANWTDGILFSLGIEPNQIHRKNNRFELDFINVTNHLIRCVITLKTYTGFL